MVLATLLALAGADLKAYRSWTCVTPTAIDMAPRIALSCVGPSSWVTSSQNPHTPKRYKVWVNPAGKATMRSPLYREVKPGEWKETATTFPEGSVIVKEKFDASIGVREAIAGKVAKPLPAKAELLTIMIKGRRGSKPWTGDWSYFVADGALKKLDASQESRCVSCHSAKPLRDFTFRDYAR